MGRVRRASWCFRLLQFDSRLASFGTKTEGKAESSPRVCYDAKTQMQKQRQIQEKGSDLLGVCYDEGGAWMCDDETRLYLASLK